MKRYFFIFLASFLAIISDNCFGQDLLAIMSEAEVNDPVFREAQSNTLAVSEGIPQARAEAWLPELSFSAGASRVQQTIAIDSQ